MKAPVAVLLIVLSFFEATVIAGEMALDGGADEVVYAQASTWPDLFPKGAWCVTEVLTCQANPAGVSNTPCVCQNPMQTEQQRAYPNYDGIWVPGYRN